MKLNKVWDALVSVAITALVLFMLMELIEPYMWLIVVSIIAVFIGSKVYNKTRRW